MELQALALLHLIVQSNPSGHCTLPHGLLAEHSIWQVRSLSSHDVHGLGQLLAVGCSTQYPLSQVRPSVQSLSLLHANSLECRLTKQLVIASGASQPIARTTTAAAGFLICLPRS
jgi:hypothetical protein